jgi:hypothetical protein
MVHLKRSRLPAIRALTVVTLDEGMPLGAGEPSLGSASTRAIRAALGLKDLGVSVVIGRHDDLVLLAVAGVVKTFRGTPLFWV